MAGDWIKLEHSTPDKPEVFRIAETLSITPEHALGCLVRVWMWADQQIANGNAASVTETTIDRIARVTGFGSAMVSAGWLCVTEADIAFPNFERHNGKTAKTRALTAKRVAKCKTEKSNAAVTQRALPREEKRREEEGEGAPAPIPITGIPTQIPPLIEWVRAYSSLTSPPIDPEHFFAHHEARGWFLRQGVKMRNWQKSMVTWAKNEKKFSGNGKPHQREFPAAQSVPPMPDVSKGERYIP